MELEDELIARILHQSVENVSVRKYPSANPAVKIDKAKVAVTEEEGIVAK